MKMQKTASRMKAFNEVDKQCIPNSKEQRVEVATAQWAKASHNEPRDLGSISLIRGHFRHLPHLPLPPTPWQSPRSYQKKGQTYMYICL